MTTTVVSKYDRELHDEVAADDVAGSSAILQRVEERINALTEATTHKDPPGGTRSTVNAPTQTHRGADGATETGKPILRLVNGAFWISDEGNGPPLVREFDSATAVSIATGAGGSGLYPANGGNFEMGVAYVSPGIDTMQVAVLVKADDMGGGTREPQIRAVNLTDGTATEWQDLTTTTDPVWLILGQTTELSVTPSEPDQKRIVLDIEVKNNHSGNSRVTLYDAVPYEHED